MKSSVYFLDDVRSQSKMESERRVFIFIWHRCQVGTDTNGVFSAASTPMSCQKSHFPLIVFLTRHIFLLNWIQGHTGPYYSNFVSMYCLPIVSLLRVLLSSSRTGLSESRQTLKLYYEPTQLKPWIQRAHRNWGPTWKSEINTKAVIVLFHAFILVVLQAILSLCIKVETNYYILNRKHLCLSMTWNCRQLKSV